MSEDWIRIESDALSAAVNPFGAELSSLRDAHGRELMHDGDPAFWAGRAPILFPIVGELADERYRDRGRFLKMQRHGFARRMPFELVMQKSDRALFRLADTPGTLEQYLYFFNLYIEFRLEGPTLVMAALLANTSDRALPASFGFHPAFAWPLPYGRPREAHRIRFEKEEPAPLKQLANGLIAVEDRPTPVVGDRLDLRDELFEQDALIWEGIESDSLIYGADEGPNLRISWTNTPNFGVWTKPGAPFVCIEPWAGIADRVHATHDVFQKPGIVRVPSGKTVEWTMRVTLQGFDEQAA